MQDDDDSFDSLNDLIMEFRAEMQEENEKTLGKQQNNQKRSDPMLISSPDLPDILLHMLRSAPDVKKHISCLRDIGMYFLEEAEKLEGRSPVNFHISNHLH